jgi:hypothetical protein
MDDIDLWNAAAAEYDARLMSGRVWRHQHVVSPAVRELLGTDCARTAGRHAHMGAVPGHELRSGRPYQRTSPGR